MIKFINGNKKDHVGGGREGYANAVRNHNNNIRYNYKHPWLRGICGEKPNQWNLAFTVAKFAQNSVVHHSTGHSPFSVVYPKATRHAFRLNQVSRGSFFNSLAKNLALQWIDRKEEVGGQKCKMASDQHCKKHIFKVGWQIHSISMKGEIFSRHIQQLTSYDMGLHRRSTIMLTLWIYLIIWRYAKHLM